jgi:uncharacterized protein YceK
MTRWMALAATSALLSACASMELRGVAAFDPAAAKPWSVYPGTLQDARAVRAAFGGDHLGGNAWLKAPVALLDLPLSMTAATICLPYDLAMASTEAPQSSPRSQPLNAASR